MTGFGSRAARRSWSIGDAFRRRAPPLCGQSDYPSIRALKLGTPDDLAFDTFGQWILDVLSPRTEDRWVYMKSQDIVIMLKLVSLEDQIRQAHLDEPTTSDPFALRSLEGDLGISKTEIGASIRRSIASNLAIKSNDRAKVNRRNLIEFVQHGLKYVFPAKPTAPQRGERSWPTRWVAGPAPWSICPPSWRPPMRCCAVPRRPRPSWASARSPGRWPTAERPGPQPSW